MLEARLRTLVDDVHGRIRGARSDSRHRRDVTDQGEVSEIEVQDDLEFALIQMKAQTLKQVDSALRRFEEGTYGKCVECGDAIAESRLRALPFAVRCKACEETRERSEPSRSQQEWRTSWPESSSID
jgi:DnaK suppressor protein